MSQKVKLTLSGELENIPEGDGEEFEAWCEAKGFHPVNGNRRAWCNALKTYLRDAEYIFHMDTGDMVLLSHDDILEPSVIVEKDSV